MHFVLALLGLAWVGLGRGHRHSDETEAAFDSDFHLVEKSGGLYWPKCPVSSVFGQCNLEDFEVSLGNVLGAGGYGKVYLGRHKPTGKSVALKQITLEKLNPRHVEHEETIHHSLHHPYISKFHCTMRDSAGNVFFAIEYIPGNNLGRRLSNKKERVGRSQIQKWVAEIVLALEYLHDRCIVYRDLKASNILVSQRNHIKLIDFGLSVYDCDDRLRGFAGTLEYAAPEMAAHKYYGRAVDYYSLGILVFRMLTGRLPISRTDVDMDKHEFLEMVAHGFRFPSTGDKIADDLIAHFCDRNVANRYGLRAESHKLIRDHPFFHGFSWAAVKRPEAPEDSLVSVAQARDMVPLSKLFELQSDSDSD